MSETPNGNGNGTWARWQVVLGAVGTMFTVGAAATFLIAAITTQGQQITELKARLDAQVTLVTQSYDRLQTAQENIAAIRRDLIEIETQFCSEDALRNQGHANDLRTFAIIMDTLKIKFDISNAYYGRVGRCPGVQ